VVEGLKAMATRRHQSMEQEVRDLLEEAVSDRQSLVAQLEAAWSRQSRLPGKAEVDAWIGLGREVAAPGKARRK
jgi:plasmid stability protein